MQYTDVRRTLVMVRLVTHVSKLVLTFMKNSVVENPFQLFITLPLFYISIKADDMDVHVNSS
jgi:hypothetical protein